LQIKKALITFVLNTNRLKFKFVETSVTTTKNVDVLYSRLKKDYPDILEKELRRIDAFLSLRKVQGSVTPNTITMQEIVSEVNDVRANRCARNKSSL